MTEPLLSERDVARLFSVGKSTVRRWRASGRLPFFRLGDVIRYREADVETFQANYLEGANVVELPTVKQGKRR